MSAHDRADDPPLLLRDEAGPGIAPQVPLDPLARIVEVVAVSYTHLPTVQASGEWYKVGGLVSNVFSGSALRCKVIGGTVKQLHTYGTAGGITGYSKDSSFVECASSAANTAAYTGGISGYAEGSIVLQNCRWTSPSHAVYLYGDRKSVV